MPSAYAFEFPLLPVCLSLSTQEIFDAGIRLLPRSSVVNIVRMALRSTSVAAMRTFSAGPEGVKSFNMYAVEKLAHNLLTIERFATRWVWVGGWV